MYILDQNISLGHIIWMVLLLTVLNPRKTYVHIGNLFKVSLTHFRCGCKSQSFAGIDHEIFQLSRLKCMLIKLFVTLVHSILEYFNSVWGPSLADHLFLIKGKLNRFSIELLECYHRLETSLIGRGSWYCSWGDMIPLYKILIITILVGLIATYLLKYHWTSI